MAVALRDLKNKAVKIKDVVKNIELKNEMVELREELEKEGFAAAAIDKVLIERTNMRLHDVIDAVDRANNETYSEKVSDVMTVIDAFGGASESDFVAFKKLKSTSVFLATLADASNSSSADVAMVLTTFVDEAEVYRAKRSEFCVVLYRVRS